MGELTQDDTIDIMLTNYIYGIEMRIICDTKENLLQLVKLSVQIALYSIFLTIFSHKPIADIHTVLALTSYAFSP